MPSKLMRDIMINDFQGKSQSWALAIQIVRIFHSNNIKTKRAITKISSSASCMESGRFISISILERIFESFPIERRLIHELYYSMDTSASSSRFDWRVFLFMLHCASFITKSPRDMLKEAFLFYSGAALDIDGVCNSRVNLRDLQFIFKSFIRLDKAGTLEDEFRQCWNDRAAHDVNFAYMVMTTSVYVSIDIFTSIIQNMNTLDSDDFEDQFYPKPLVQHIKSRRMMMNAFHKMTTRRKLHAVKVWRDVVERRRHMHIMMEKVFKACARAFFRHGFLAIMRTTMEFNAAIIIQKCSLKYLSRVCRVRIKISDKSAIHIQKVFRGYKARYDYKGMVCIRFFAAVDIQRTFRGYLGHRIGKARAWVKQNDYEMLLQLELDREYQYMIIQSSIIIQRVFRGYRARVKFKTEVERSIRSLKVAAEIEEQERLYLRETLIHEQQLKFHFEEVRRKIRNQRIVAKRTDEHKEALHRLRLRLRDSDKEYYMDEKRRATMQLILDKQETFRRTRITEMEMERDEFKDHCRMCIRNPGTIEERKFGKNLKNKIKERVTDVLKRADERGLELEITEAKEVAQEEIIEIMTLEKIDQMHRDMKQELQMIETIELREFKRIVAEDRERSAVRASRLIVSSIRRWKARKELFRRCSESFEKLFDEKYKAFYYRNIRTGQVMWKKPKALGALDLEVQEQYKEWL